MSKAVASFRSLLPQRGLLDTIAVSATGCNSPFQLVRSIRNSFIPNVGTVAVPDARLELLRRIAKTSVDIPAAIEFVDIAGLVKGASAGEGLGNGSDVMLFKFNV